ncbi:hypothetical protein HY285_05000 [Candidatus Peregrinibacteria bacterium]|nr:hypothetical protein [Candidatus Peregrinibacteria bacterium]MBI3816869.1 hypothetical protein [Candidatus Peregrinibacteria bacterium]
MMQRLRESLALVLIGTLPFHAFLVTVLTRMIAGPGHAPLTMLTLWKEILLAIIVLIALLEWNAAILDRERRSDVLQFDWIDGLILILLNLAIVVSAAAHVSLGQFFVGLKYDFIGPLSFLVLRRVAWSGTFLHRMSMMLPVIGGVLALYGIDSFFLPQNFFSALGYSDYHSLYMPSGPIAAFQQIVGTGIRRIQSVMSGPNQYGLWILIPWCFALQTWLQQPSLRRSICSIDAVKALVRRARPAEIPAFPWYLLLLAIALFLTFSRTAWIAVALVTIIALLHRNKELLRSWFNRRVGFAVAAVAIILFVAFPAVFFRLSSTRGHVDRPIDGIVTILAHPFGLGLGSAGPASNRGSDACVFLEPNDDPSWAKSIPNLCVYVGSVKVQPARDCRCPLLPENWYLQMGIEMGVAGFGLYVALVILVLKKLRRAKGEGQLTKGSQFAIRNSQFATQAVFLIFLGLSIAGLFLHSWEDSAAAYTVWMLVAAMENARGRDCSGDGMHHPL